MTESIKIHETKCYRFEAATFKHPLKTNVAPVSSVVLRFTRVETKQDTSASSYGPIQWAIECSDSPLGLADGEIYGFRCGHYVGECRIETNADAVQGCGIGLLRGYQWTDVDGEISCNALSWL